MNRSFFALVPSPIAVTEALFNRLVTASPFGLPIVSQVLTFYPLSVVVVSLLIRFLAVFSDFQTPLRVKVFLRPPSSVVFVSFFPRKVFLFGQTPIFFGFRVE